MNDLGRFAMFMLAASVVFLTVLVLVLRRRTNKPGPVKLFILTVLVVVCGMLFARYGHILFHLPWWIYYGFPALMTFPASTCAENEHCGGGSIPTDGGPDGPCHSCLVFTLRRMARLHALSFLHTVTGGTHPPNCLIVFL